MAEQKDAISETLMPAPTTQISPFVPAAPGGQDVSLPAAPPPADLTVPEPLPAILERVDWLLVGLLLVLAFLLGSFAATNSDVWLQLASGRRIAEGRWTIGVDPFSFATEATTVRPAVPWVEHSWLYSLAFYWLYNLVGGAGLVVLKALAVVALAWCLLQIPGGKANRFVSFIYVSLALLALSPHLLLRPVTVSFLFFAITLLTCYRAGAWGARRSIPASCGACPCYSSCGQTWMPGSSWGPWRCASLGRKRAGPVAWLTGSFSGQDAGSRPRGRPFGVPRESASCPGFHAPTGVGQPHRALRRVAGFSPGRRTRIAQPPPGRTRLLSAGVAAVAALLAKPEYRGGVLLPLAGPGRDLVRGERPGVKETWRGGAASGALCALDRAGVSRPAASTAAPLVRYRDGATDVAEPGGLAGRREQGSSAGLAGGPVRSLRGAGGRPAGPLPRLARLAERFLGRLDGAPARGLDNAGRFFVSSRRLAPGSASRRRQRAARIQFRSGHRLVLCLVRAGGQVLRRFARSLFADETARYAVRDSAVVRQHAGDLAKSICRSQDRLSRPRQIPDPARKRAHGPAVAG